ncbi:MAG TPA: bifunctional DNA-formamidopyrimidine glycosylase/DNA-(apurinic or apyrimidinic site) lyase [Terriglobia bacterium]|nr:bifunctional DNA-formamidopyrimidine glycosylase/DNA-(apurinic or apyrimidinic site) lyase [Terriglobia bacterium]
MPELPEVETIRRGLVEKVIGRTIERVEIRSNRIVLYPKPNQLQEALRHQTIRQISRRGKFLVLDVGDYHLLIHLGMTGQLTYWAQSQEDDNLFFRHPRTGLQKARQHRVDKHTHISLYFTNGEALHYRDIRQFGRWRLYRPEELAMAPEFVKLGPEPFTADYTWKRFLEAFKGRKLRIKSLLLDQRFVAGVGNIYADEALFDSRIHPERKAESLSNDEKRRLFRAIPRVLKRGLKYGGTSFQDYINAEGLAGTNQERLHVYGREGEKCLRCKLSIQRIVVSQRSSHFCPHCQPDNK